MTSSEIAIRDTAAVTERDVVDGWVSVVRDVGNLADYIAETDFVPKALRNKPAAVAACILTGRELGIGPMASLKSIHMVQGVPSLSAEYKRARALAAGNEIIIDETNATRCVVRGRRPGGAWVTVTWTIDMARRAGIGGKDVWKQYPQRMLQARATSELCDLLFPDATLGLETTEVLQDGGALAIAEAVVVSEEEAAEAAERSKGKPRTAQRKTRQAKPEPPKPEPKQETPEPDAALPPLPGEEEPAPAPDETDYSTPGTVTPAQLKAIWTILGQVYHFGDDEKDNARSVCAHIASRDLASSKDLTHNEAKAVLDTLAHWQHQAQQQGDDPRAYLLAVMAGETAES